MVKYFSLGGMAQLVEHSLHMRGVTGSSPVVSTKIKAHQSWWAFILVKTTCGRETENLFSAFGGCLQTLALCTVYIVADTLCRCVVYFYSSLCRAAPVIFYFDNRLELGRFYRPRAKLHVCDQGHTARDWPLVTIAVDESCCLHQTNLRARTRKLVFGVRRLLATACVMHRVYRSRHFVSLRCLFLFFTMQSSPCCLLFRQQKRTQLAFFFVKYLAQIK